MNKFTNAGLVAHAKTALALKTKYMWAGTLNPITDAYITQKVEQCKKSGVSASRSGYTNARIYELRKIAGQGYYGVDCVCLVKSYLWGGIECPKYDNKYDINANVMYDMAKEKGKIDTMPDIPGIIVYSKTHPHVGIYIGSGETIESTLGTRGDGVVKRKLDNFWEYWFKCPFIEYSKPEEQKTQEKTQEFKLKYPAKLRIEPSSSSKQIDRLVAGRKVTVALGSETTDKTTGYVYVRLTGNFSGWIVKSAISE